MSGTIFPSQDILDDFDSSKWNPLQCNICNEQYQEPCILKCYHSFCAKCVKPEVKDGQFVCPVCSTITFLKEGSDLPPPDPLLKFLVESSAGDTIQCANCDQTNVEMFYCKTCCQPLCVQCRQETHRAKMFVRHDVVLHTKHTRDIQKDCKIHGEPYILFSTEKKIMLCINCFRDMKVESRSHCVDLETAYKQGCQKLGDTMQSIKDLQNSVRDGILLLRALLEEIQTNAESEKQDISELYNTMQEKIQETKESLMQEIDRQFDEKEELFKNQLVSLRTFLPTLHVHLVTCAAFCSSTNKYEFLNFTYALMKRLTAIIQVQQPLHPSQTSDIVTDYRVKFAKCLEPVLFPHRNGTSVSVPVSISTNAAVTRFDTSPANTSTSEVRSDHLLPNRISTVSLNYKHTKKKLKLLLMEKKGFFADHCTDFDTAHREFMHTVQGLKQSVQELQRDITLRRSLMKDLTIIDLKAKICETEELLSIHRTVMEEKQLGLEKYWEESLDMIAAEQEVYQAQLQDVDRLKTEVGSVKTILQKLTSFMSSIANVTQRLSPKLNKAQCTTEYDSQHALLLQEINTVQPDSQQRVDAIRTAQEERDIKTANRVNPLDEELIKTKGLLRSLSARKDSAKRLSAEINEVKVNDEKVDNSPAKLEKASLSEGIEGMADNTKAECDVLVIADNSCEIALDVVSSVNTLIDVLPCDLGVDISELSHSNELDSDLDIVKSQANYADSVPKDLSECVTCSDTHISNSSAGDNADTCINITIQAMPDVTAQVVACGNEVNKVSGLWLQATPSSVVDVKSKISSGNEFDVDTSLDSIQNYASEESIKPGHVKDLIAKVHSISKPSDTIGKSAEVLIKDKSSNLLEERNDRASKTVLDKKFKIDSLNANHSENEMKAANDQGLAVNVESALENAATGGNKEDVYVVKSLPELAQVFEPVDLKHRKRKCNKNEKGKSSQ